MAAAALFLFHFTTVIKLALSSQSRTVSPHREVEFLGHFAFCPARDIIEGEAKCYDDFRLLIIITRCMDSSLARVCAARALYFLYRCAHGTSKSTHIIFLGRDSSSDLHLRERLARWRAASKSNERSPCVLSNFGQCQSRGTFNSLNIKMLSDQTAFYTRAV